MSHSPTIQRELQHTVITTTTWLRIFAHRAEDHLICAIPFRDPRVIYYGTKPAHVHDADQQHDRWARVPDLPVPEGDEADAGAQEARTHQSLPGRTERVDDQCLANG